MSPIQSLAERHRQHLEALNFSPCTLRNRAANLRQFFRFLKGKRIRDIQAVNGRVLNQYQLWLHRFPCQRGGLRTAATLNRGLATIKVFFRYLYETGRIESVAVVSLLGYRDRAILAGTIQLIVGQASRLSRETSSASCNAGISWHTNW